MSLPEKYVAIDTETTGLYHWRGHKVFSAAAAFPDGKIRFWREDFTGFKELCEDPAVDKVFHNAVFDWGMIESMGIKLRGRIWDTMCLAQLRDGTTPLGLDFCAKQYLPPQFRKVTNEVNDWFKEHKTTKERRAKAFDLLPPDLLKRRVVGDATCTIALFRKLFPFVYESHRKLLIQEHKLLAITKEMTDTGLELDFDSIAEQRASLVEAIELAMDFFEGLTGSEEFNPNSHAQVKALIKQHGLDKYLPVTATGAPKTDMISLRAVKHPITMNIIAYRSASKLLGSFVDGIPTLAVDKTLHPVFRQFGTTTGRYSCSEPNAMNLPNESESRLGWSDEEVECLTTFTGSALGNRVKRMFKVRDGMVHIHSDKSKIEVAMLAHYSKDKFLIEALKQGKDLHSEVSRLLFNSEDKHFRRRAKDTVFSYQYGAGIATMAERLQITQAEAKRLRDQLASKIPALPRWKAQLAREVFSKGYVRTDFGRNHYLSSTDTYKAVNRMCQSTAGDEVKSRMVALWEEFRKRRWPCKILLNIHDDIGIQCPRDLVVEAAPVIHKIMEETAIPYRIPLPSSLEVCLTSWADSHAVDTNNISQDVERILREQ